MCTLPAICVIHSCPNWIFSSGVEEDNHWQAVYVGKSRRRYHIRSQVAEHPVFQELVERSGSGDKDTVDCEVVLFEHLLWMLENADPQPDSLQDLVDLLLTAVTKHLLPASLLIPTCTQSPKQHYSFANNPFKSHFHGLTLTLSSTPLSPLTTKTALTVVSAKVNKGSAPPSFTLKDQDGKTVSLSKFKGKPVVVYFYPADETPGCTKQACAFRDSYEKFKKAGAQVVGISGDDAASHKAFAKKYRLPFTLLSDEGNKVRKEWGVPSDLFGTLPGRQTYVLDKNGVVQLIYNNQFQPEKHIDETLKLLQSL
ncbi:hypothetical protein L1987_70047 [Smallanthus sonchifolius]|uniref:Uncharacterized protein n=1 Tax=Smallanthus sonchifolius TaxID=185202 RepID=A0ACB9AMN8_9ASTR|nr:hypothetical protein L1987_70047 [Smallanthus sonchifolius]